MCILCFSRTPNLIKSHLLRQNNNNETSPHASPRSSPKLSVDSTTTAADTVKNGKVEEPKPVRQLPPAQPSPGLTQVTDSYGLGKQQRTRRFDGSRLVQSIQEKESSNDSSTAFITPTEPKDSNKKEAISQVSVWHVMLLNTY